MIHEPLDQSLDLLERYDFGTEERLVRVDDGFRDGRRIGGRAQLADGHGAFACIGARERISVYCVRAERESYYAVSLTQLPVLFVHEGELRRLEDEAE